MYTNTICFILHFNSQTSPPSKNTLLFDVEGGKFAQSNVRLMNMTFWRSVSVEEIDIAIKFTKREIQFMSGGSSEYQYAHQFEIHRIDRLQIGGDVEYIEEVALRYKNWFI